MAKHIGFFSSLRFKFALLLALFSGLLMLGAMYLLEKDVRQSLISESIAKGVGIARAVALNAEDPLLTGDDIYLFTAVNNSMKSPGIVYSHIVDDKGEVKASGDVSLVGKSFKPVSGTLAGFTQQGFNVARDTSKLPAVLELTVPITSLVDESIKLGSIYLGLSEKLITDAVNEMRRNITILTSAALIIGCMIAYFLASFFVRPVASLVTGVRAIGEGDFNQKIELNRNDELGVLTDSFNEMAESLREKEYIKNTFERYMSKQLADDLLNRQDELKLGGDEKLVSILFSDLRGFTTISENLTAPEVVELLNNYFDQMISIVEENQGMVDKFIGDALMALFGAPLPMGNDAYHAVKCALEMQGALESLNAEREKNNETHLEMGIGVNTGKVVAGNIGSHSRMEYTVIGDNVNLSSRLEGMTKQYGCPVLISQQTFDALNGEVICRPVDIVRVKGKSQGVRVYEALALKESPDAAAMQNVATISTEAFDAYLAQEWDRGLSLFAEVTELKQGDQLSAMISERCSTYKESPPASGWDGVYTLTSK